MLIGDRLGHAGALGGLAVGIVAPKLFNTYYEFGIGLVATLLIAAWVTLKAAPLVSVTALLVAIGAGWFVTHYIYTLSRDVRVMSRNFYGTLRVKDVGEEDGQVRRLMHGVIMHGEQYLAPDRRREPTTYYGATSGIGRLMKAFDTPGLRVGVVGLGTGTLAVYGTEGAAWSEEDGARLFRQKMGEQTRSEHPVDAVDGLADQLQEFATCIRTGARPEVSGPEALEVVAILEACMKSHAEDRPVALEELGV